MVFFPFPLASLVPSPGPTPVPSPEASSAPNVTTSPVRDILLTDAGNLWIWGGDLHLVGGLDAIHQECKTALELWQGEYILDANAGIPWQDLLSKGVGEAQIAAAIRAQLLTVPGVTSVDNITFERDPVTRTAAISVSVSTDDGETLTITTTQGAA